MKATSEAAKVGDEKSGDVIIDGVGVETSSADADESGVRCEGESGTPQCDANPGLLDRLDMDVEIVRPPVLHGDATGSDKVDNDAATKESVSSPEPTDNEGVSSEEVAGEAALSEEVGGEAGAMPTAVVAAGKASVDAPKSPQKAGVRSAVSPRPPPRTFTAASPQGSSVVMAYPLEQQNRIFVTRVALVLKPEEVEEYFTEIGVLTDFYMPTNKSDGTHKGIAFASFEKADDKTIALEKPKHIIKGHEVVVDDARKKFSRAEGKGSTSGEHRVFVTRLAEQVTKDDLRTYFEQFGELTDLFVPLRNGGPGPDGKERHKGIAFLSFRDYEPFVEVLSREKYEIKPGYTVVVDKAAGKDGDAKGKKGYWDYGYEKGYGKGGKKGKGFGGYWPQFDDEYLEEYEAYLWDRALRRRAEMRELAFSKGKGSPRTGFAGASSGPHLKGGYNQPAIRNWSQSAAQRSGGSSISGANTVGPQYPRRQGMAGPGGSPAAIANSASDSLPWNQQLSQIVQQAGRQAADQTKHQHGFCNFAGANGFGQQRQPQQQQQRVQPGGAQQQDDIQQWMDDWWQQGMENAASQSGNRNAVGHPPDQVVNGAYMGPIDMGYVNNVLGLPEKPAPSGSAKPDTAMWDSIFGTSTGAQGTSQWKGWDDQAWATAMNDYGVKPVSGNGAVWGGGSSAANFRQNPY